MVSIRSSELVSVSTEDCKNLKFNFLHNKASQKFAVLVPAKAWVFRLNSFCQWANDSVSTVKGGGKNFRSREIFRFQIV
jgi:hypothetical protein